MKKMLLIIPLILFVSLACSSTLANTPDPKATATMTQRPGTPTMNMQQFSLTMVANEQNNGLTEAANKTSVELAKIELEKIAIRSTAAADDKKATQAAANTTAEAYSVMQTAWADSTETAKAEATHGAATSIAAVKTEQVAPTAAIWTAEAIQREARIQEAEVQTVELARDRQVAKNPLDALLPWTLTILAMAGVVYAMRDYLNNRLVARDEHGRMPTIMRALPDGGVTITRPELMPGPYVTITPDGEIITPEPTDKPEQSDVTRRAQIVEAISSLPLPYARNAQGMMKTEFGNGMASPTVQIINDAKALSPVLDEAEGRLVEE
jgi:hypothetical protein